MSALPFALLRGGWTPRAFRPPREAPLQRNWIFVDDSGNAVEVASEVAFVRVANFPPEQKSATTHHGENGQRSPHHRQA